MKEIIKVAWTLKRKQNKYKHNPSTKVANKK